MTNEVIEVDGEKVKLGIPASVQNSEIFKATGLIIPFLSKIDSSLATQGYGGRSGRKYFVTF
jgi:hypothetical protein